MSKTYIIAILLLLAMAPLSAQGPRRITVDQPSLGYELTVYNQNMGLVKDQREVTLDTGQTLVDFTNVAALIDPTSVHFTSLTNPQGVSILEQNFQYDLVNTEKMLQKYLGEKIRIRQKIDGSEKVIEGTLLSAAGGIVLKTDQGILLNPQGQVELPDLPEGLIIKPTLLWLLDATAGGKQTVEVSYITDGLNWSADYVAVVNQDDTMLGLNGWVTLNNTSGASYKNAGLKLIAGDVHRVTPPPPTEVPDVMYDMSAAVPESAPQFQEKAFFEYHMYTLQRRTDVLNNETKQVSLLEAAGVPAKKVYIFESAPANPYGGSSDAGKVQVKLEFKNSEENHLGMPLPKGKIRVYKEDADKSLQFVGEDEIDHTPKDETLRIYLGNAFDLVGERAQMDHQQISDRVSEDSYQVKLRNHKTAAVTITVVDHFYGDWQILKSSFDYRKKDANTAEFDILVEPDKEVTLTYTVRTKY